jgi:ATP-binding cassette subfamily D (ALD) protein 3
MTAYFLLSRPVFDTRYATEYMGKETNDKTKIMEDYTRNSAYLVNLSQAIGRVILAGRDLTRVCCDMFFDGILFDSLQDIHLELQSL